MDATTKVLLIDDDPRHLETLTWRLKDRCQLEAVNTLAKAQEYLNRQSPDVILLDVGLPETKDDMDTLQKVKGMPGTANSAIVIVSGNSDPSFMMEAILSSANGYIVKGSGDRTFDLIAHQCDRAIQNKLDMLKKHTGRIQTI